jgi:hypothetical protein
VSHFSAIACAALVAFSAGAFADQQIDAIVDPIIEKEMAAGTPGAAFVFVRDGKVVYQRGYGFSDVASAKKVDPQQTVWPIASVTKAITAMAAATAAYMVACYPCISPTAALVTAKFSRRNSCARCTSNKPPIIPTSPAGAWAFSGRASSVTPTAFHAG